MSHSLKENKKDPLLSEKGQDQETVFIAAGGTGGHFFAAEALAADLLSRGVKVVLLTDKRGAKLPGPVFEQCQIFTVPGRGIAGKNLLQKVLAVILLTKGIFITSRLLRGFAPQAVVAFGGYPSLAPILAAKNMKDRPRLILHEQNIVLGRANRFLLRQAGAQIDVLALSFPGTSAVPPLPSSVKICQIGLPVRASLLSLLKKEYLPPTSEGPLHLLITGGSQGARALSELIPEALKALPENLKKRLAVVQQCRSEDLPKVGEIYQKAGIKAELASFFTDMPERLAKAHLVLARAGASTLAELSLAGRPAILFPLPGSIDGHQQKNAEFFAEHQAAFLFSEKTDAVPDLTALLEKILTSPDQLAKQAACARSLAKAEATAELSLYVLQKTASV